MTKSGHRTPWLCTWGVLAGVLVLLSSCGPPVEPVSDHAYVQLGGVSQYVEVRGDSPDLPLLLYLHGGPGWPETPMMRYYNAPLRKHFLVALWDQRGAGLSLKPDPTPPPVSISRFVADAHALTLYLKRTYGKKKIYLLAHSWGSVIGLQLIRQYPQDYQAYAAVGQVVDMIRGEELANAYIRERASKEDDQATLEALDQLNFSEKDGYEGRVAGFIKQRKLLSKYRGRPLGASFDDLSPEALSGYENYEWLQPILYAFDRLYDELLHTDFTGDTDFEVPVHFFEGRYDYNTPSTLAYDYFQTIRAPEKSFHWFESSGHSPHWEEPERFNRLLVETLLGSAD